MFRLIFIDWIDISRFRLIDIYRFRLTDIYRFRLIDIYRFRLIDIYRFRFTLLFGCCLVGFVCTEKSENINQKMKTRSVLDFKIRKSL